MFFGSWLTIDKINTAVKKTLIASEGLRGEFGLMSGKMEGEYAKSFANYKKRIEALDSAYEMGTDKAGKLVASYTTVGHAVEDLNEETLVLAAGWDYLLGQPTGTWLTQRAQEAGTFGDKMGEAAMAATELYLQFGAFTKEGRKSAITVTDMQASMETASRTMAGWNSDFRSMSKFQQAFIEGSEEAGRTSKGAAESFGGFVGEIGNLDMEQMLVLQQTFKEVGKGKGVVGAIGDLAKTKGYGGGPVGEAFAMQRFMKEGPEGMQSEFLFTMIDAMATMSERMTGGGAMAIRMAQQMFGMSEDRAVEMINGIDKIREAYTEEQPLSTKMTEEMKNDLAKAQARARADALTMPEKIQAGIGLWWREVAPALFSTIVNGFGLIYDSIVWLSTFLKFGQGDLRKVAAERIEIRGERIGENAKILQEASKHLVKGVTDEVTGSFKESLGETRELPEYGAIYSEAAVAKRATEGEKRAREEVAGGDRGNPLYKALGGGGDGGEAGQAVVENLPDGGIKATIPMTREVIFDASVLNTSFSLIGNNTDLLAKYGKKI
jgi:hypothetical protein